MKRAALIDVLAAGTVIVILAAVLIFVFVGPSEDIWITREAEWSDHDIEIYTENLHLLKLAHAGHVQEGTRRAAEILEIRESSLRELGVAEDDRRVVWMRVRVKARRWQGDWTVADGGVLLPGGEYNLHFFGRGYKVDGWIIKVD